MFVLLEADSYENGRKMANISEGRKKLAQSCVEDGTFLDAKEVNKYMAEQEWDHCIKDLQDNSVAPKDKYSNLHQTKTVVSKEPIVNFHSQKKHIPRRYLRHMNRKHHRVLTVALTPGPVPGPAIPPMDDEPPTLPKSILPHVENSDNNNQKYMLVGIVTISVVGLAIVALLLFVCLKRKRRVEPKEEGQRDEKPLLNFTISDISSGSSGHTLSNPSGKDFAKNPSAAGLSQATNPDPSQANSEANGAAQTEGKTVNALPLPPGRKPPPAAPPEPPTPPPPKPPAPAAPPPPPKIVRRPPPPNPPVQAKPSPLGPHHRRSSTGEKSNGSDESESEAPKTKLKPFFWDKVLASPNHSMVWHEIKAGSFQFNEEMMETLFGYTQADKNKNDRKKDSSSLDSPQHIQIIDPKKSQNLAILLKALNVTTEEICDALQEGNALPSELIQTLLRMAPTADEELKLRLYGEDIARLGPSERFLKVMLDIPFAFKRLEALLFVSTFHEDFSSTKESLATLEVYIPLLLPYCPNCLYKFQKNKK
ncbi:formin-like protein [Striga asiatica]|uniref:Formin-like protein n=1 Tax=Striga asiatica TaxID=4170 RepID=A0A5A7PFC3_STRAF|nr:formin-like protein [Striga asiatica]